MADDKVKMSAPVLTAGGAVNQQYNAALNPMIMGQGYQPAAPAQPQPPAQPPVQAPPVMGQPNNPSQPAQPPQAPLPPGGYIGGTAGNGSIKPSDMATIDFLSQPDTPENVAAWQSKYGELPPQYQQKKDFIEKNNMDSAWVDTMYRHAPEDELLRLWQSPHHEDFANKVRAGRFSNPSQAHKDYYWKAYGTEPRLIPDYDPNVLH